MSDYLYFRLMLRGLTVGFSRLDPQGNAKYLLLSSKKWIDDPIRYDDSIKLDEAPFDQLME